MDFPDCEYNFEISKTFENLCEHQNHIDYF